MNAGLHRSSLSAEYGLLESPDGDPETTNGEETIVGPKPIHNGSSSPVYLTLPPFIRQESNISSDSYADSFTTAQSSATIKAAAKAPDFSRQNTDATTMSYATARGDVL